jgi:ferritin
MELTKKLSDAFNAQIKAEMWSSNLYLSMSVFFKNAGLNGCAHWMKEQAEEELEHAHKLIDFGVMRGGDIAISAIDSVPVSWESPLAVFEEVYKHEIHVSEMIDKLMDIAIEENDKATQEFLRWFINEQIEEEDTAKTIIERFKMAGTSGLVFFDNELGNRK